jgi:hypothetical protein
MSAVQKLQIKASSLSEFEAEKVLHFVDAMVAQATEKKQAEQTRIRNLRGAFKGKLSSSAAFAAQKSHEVSLEG